MIRIRFYYSGNVVDAGYGLIDTLDEFNMNPDNNYTFETKTELDKYSSENNVYLYDKDTQDKLEWYSGGDKYPVFKDFTSEEFAEFILEFA